MPPLFWRVLADITVIAHVGYVSFVVFGHVFGQLLILIGALRGWRWIRNRTFRFAHLAAIVIVVLEAWIGMTCPLTTWENTFRKWAGQTTYRGDFLAHWMHDLLFFDAPAWAFTACYTAFGAVVLTTLWYAPPTRRIAA
jgi:hypothetical protein